MSPDRAEREAGPTICSPGGETFIEMLTIELQRYETDWARAESQ